MARIPGVTVPIDAEIDQVQEPDDEVHDEPEADDAPTTFAMDD